MTAREQTLLEAPGVRVRALVLAPGEGTPWHHHTNVDDLIVCLSGSVSVLLTTGPTVLLPGQRTRIPARTPHQVVNVAPSESEYLLIQGVGTYDFVRVPGPESS